MISLLRHIIHLIHRLVPKENHAVVYGWPDFEDNSLALEYQLRNSRLDKTVILTSSGEDAAPAFGPNTLCVKKNSLRGFLLFIRARYVFFTHPCFVRKFPKDVVSVNVWHGMPIKKIGRLLVGSEIIQSSHISATSPFWCEIMREAMCDASEILPLGLPRNDRLFHDSEQTRSKVNTTKESKLIIWLPTYRHSIRGAKREDGMEYGNIFAMPDFDPEQLNDYLANKGAKLLIKPHPMAPMDQPLEWSHLKVIDEAWLHEKGVSLYQVLGASDILLTDVSSVMIDYLLIDKPVIHTFSDLGAYRASRGFSVNNIDDFFAGSVVSNQVDLHLALDSELKGSDPNRDRRQALRDLSHQYKDGESTKRHLQQIGLL